MCGGSSKYRIPWPNWSRGVLRQCLRAFIDRGPEIRETLQTVRAMVDGGSTLAVMENHEFNALAYHTPDGKGGFLRKHTPKKAINADKIGGMI